MAGVMNELVKEKKNKKWGLGLTKWKFLVLWEGLVQDMTGLFDFSWHNLLKR